MAKGICVKRLENGNVDNVKVDYGNGFEFDLDVSSYIERGILPYYINLPECVDSEIKPSDSSDSGKEG